MRFFNLSWVLNLNLGLCLSSFLFLTALSVNPAYATPVCKNYFALLSTKGSTLMVEKSSLMDELYGPAIADQVYARLQFLDPVLNQLIQEVAYDRFWKLEGLSVKEKSLVTVLTLFALKKEEQSRIHLNGYFSSQGTLNEMSHYLHSIQDMIGLEGTAKAQAALQEVTHARNIGLQKDAAVSINTSYARIIVFAARGELSLLKTEIAHYFQSGGTIETLNHTFIHMIVYAGFPTAMNAFAVLSEFRESAQK